MINKNRALGASENLFWLIGQDRPIQAISVAEIEGYTTVEEWRVALDAVQQRHPLFSTSIEVGNDGIIRFRHKDNVRIPMRVMKGSLQDLDAQLSKELTIPFDDRQAPLIRTVLIHGDKRSIFVIVRHHSIGDGVSITYVFRDLLDAMNGKTLDILTTPASIDDSLGLTRNTPYDPELPSQNTAVTHPIYPRSETKTPFVQRIKLTPEATVQIINRTRKEQTTVYGTLCAAVVQAGRQLNAGWAAKPVRVLTPASTREVLHSGEGSSLSINTRIVAFDQPEMPFWDIARLSKQSLEGITSKETILNATNGLRELVFSGLTVGGAIDALNNFLAHEVLLTNIGRLNFDTDFGKLKLRNIWGPFHTSGFEGEQYIGAVTTNDSMCLSLTSNEPIEGLLPRIVEILHAESAE